MWSGRQAIVFIGISVFIMSICGCRGVTSVSEVIPASRSAAPPAIHAQANPDAIVAGQSSNLSWSATGADAVSIDGFGSQPMSGSTSVAPAQTTTYTLRAKGAGGETDTTVTVTVRHPDPPPAPIPTPSGEVNVLTWHLDNARTGLNNQEKFDARKSALGEVWEIVFLPWGWIPLCPAAVRLKPLNQWRPA